MHGENEWHNGNASVYVPVLTCSCPKYTQHLSVCNRTRVYEIWYGQWGAVHEAGLPSSLSAAVCQQPHATDTTCTPLNPSTTLGVNCHVHKANAMQATLLSGLSGLAWAQYDGLLPHHVAHSSVTESSIVIVAPCVHLPIHCVHDHHHHHGLHGQPPWLAHHAIGCMV